MDEYIYCRRHHLLRGYMASAKNIAMKMESEPLIYRTTKMTTIKLLQIATCGNISTLGLRSNDCSQCEFSSSTYGMWCNPWHSPIKCIDQIVGVTHDGSSSLVHHVGQFSASYPSNALIKHPKKLLTFNIHQTPPWQCGTI